MEATAAPLSNTSAKALKRKYAAELRAYIRHQKKHKQRALLKKIELVSGLSRAALEEHLEIVPVMGSNGRKPDGVRFSHLLRKERSPAKTADFVRWIRVAYNAGWLSEGDLAVSGYGMLVKFAKASDIQSELKRRNAALSLFSKGQTRSVQGLHPVTSAGLKGGTTTLVREHVEAVSKHEAWVDEMRSAGYWVWSNHEFHEIEDQNLEDWAREARSTPIWGSFIVRMAERWVVQTRLRRVQLIRKSQEAFAAELVEELAERAAVVKAVARSSLDDAVASQDPEQIAKAEVAWAAASAAAEMAWQKSIDAGDYAFEPPYAMDEEAFCPPYDPVAVQNLVLVDRSGDTMCFDSRGLYCSAFLETVHRQEVEAGKLKAFIDRVHARRKSGASSDEMS